jgi:hypothetical protein
MVARLGVDPIEIASDHAVFSLRPRELAPLLTAEADPRQSAAAASATGERADSNPRPPS